MRGLWALILSHSFKKIFLINFYWSIVALQCCVSFYRTAKWISYTYTYIPSFWDFLPIYVTTEHWVEFPELYSRFSLVTYFMHSINSIYMSIPISQFISSLLSQFYPILAQETDSNHSHDTWHNHMEFVHNIYWNSSHPRLTSVLFSPISDFAKTKGFLL